MGEAGSTSFIPRSRVLLAVSSVVLVLALIQLTDVIEFPFLSGIGGSTSSSSIFSTGTLTSVLDIGYAGLFVLMAMENAALPVPSELVLPLAGFLAYEGKMNLGGAIAVATAAAIVGSLVAYYVGFLLGRPIIYRLFGAVGISAARLDEGEKWVDSRGAWSVLVARFIPGLRSIISIPAGMLKMSLKPFVILTFVGSLVWNSALIYLGYSAGPLWAKASGSIVGYAEQIALVILAGVALLYVAYYFRIFGPK